MNIQFHAKETTTAAAAAEIRKRLMNPPNGHKEPKLIRRPEPIVIPVETGEPKVCFVLPMWRTARIAFDAHVIDYLGKTLPLWVKATAEVCATGLIRPPSVNTIIARVLKGHPGVTAADIIGREKPRRISNPRLQAMWAVKVLRPDMSYLAIGRAFGGRDHTTILSAFRKIEAEIAAEAGT